MSVTTAINDGINTVLGELGGIAQNPTAAAIGGAVIGGSLTGAVIGGITAVKKKRRKASSKKRKSTRRKSTRRKSTRRVKKKGRYGSAKQYRKKGGKTVHYTKNRQPYIILASGKARFIKKKHRS